MPIAFRHPSRAHLPLSLAPNAGAVGRLAGKRLVPTFLDSGEIASLPLAAREAGFFSAKVADLQTLGKMKGLLEKTVSLPAGEAFMSKDKFTTEMRRTLGAPAGDSGAMNDLASTRRLGEIYNFQIEDAYSHARWVRDQDPDLLDAYPAQELVRLEERDAPRDWEAKWKAKGGKLSKSRRMIALKNDPIWVEISAFGRPWPPFDYGSGMGLKDISREEAKAEGVLRKNEVLKAPAKTFAPYLQKSIEAASPEMIEALKDDFGDSVQVGPDGKVNFYPQIPDELLSENSQTANMEEWLDKMVAIPRFPALDLREIEAEFSVLDGKPVASPVGEVKTAFREHIEDSRADYDREHRKAYLPAALSVLKKPDGTAYVHTPGAFRPYTEVFFATFPQPGHGRAWGVKVHVERREDIVARLEAKETELRKLQEGLRTGIEREQAGKKPTEVIAASVAKKTSSIERAKAEIRVVQDALKLWRKSTAYGEAWDYYAANPDGFTKIKTEGSR